MHPYCGVALASAFIREGIENGCVVRFGIGGG